MVLLKLLATGVSGIVLILVVELIRRGRLKERYALLWLLAGCVLLILSTTKIIENVSQIVGIYYPPSALFLIAFLFLLLITLHFSVVISGLSDQNKRLAQEIALLRRDLEDRFAASRPSPPAKGAAGKPA
ncbi:MAG: hypothetical protein A2X58_07260 [Nitrospirae bacterium GWC2_56_14]|nr:MAG: hypothetical protein A2X58_07260 [Nitrospirae bacterium GWC2_56_14]